MDKETTANAIHTLKSLIQTQSFSGEEDKTGDLIEDWFMANGIIPQRLKNNIWVSNQHFDEAKPTILMNSHHDTVRPNKGYTNDPYEAKVKDGKLFGLGSNDAGGSLVALMTAFAHFYDAEDLNYNLLMAATAEEENSGKNGIKLLLPELPYIDFAIVGEPTEMQLAIAEKGLIVIDAYAKGIAGHAAHENTENAILNAMKDIEWIRTYQFPKISNTLGKTKMSVTQINAGSQHNLVPAECHFVIDIRVNEHYSNEEIYAFLTKELTSEIKPRSLNLNSSAIPSNHPIVEAGIAMGREVYGSPTLSDQANLNCPSLKIGPGKSSRSHSADEFIHLHEIEEGIEIYIALLEKILKIFKEKDIFLL